MKEIIKEVKKKYYIKYRNMYVDTIEVSEYYPENEFFQKVCFTADKDFADIYTEETAEKIREKLHDIGFEMDKTYLEEVIEEDPDK